MKARLIRNLVALALTLALPAPLFAQQTGTISGKVTASDGSALPGVTVEAKSDVLPTARVTVTNGTGEYRLLALPPGSYTLTFTLQGMAPATRTTDVQLSVDIPINVALGVAGVTEAITVTADSTIVNKNSAELKSAISYEQIRSLPVGQEYRDLIKLLPGVQYTPDVVRGPSAGGSGQDNVYNFDGVNVTLPLFGTLSAEPAAHDIAQVTTVKGGARAIDFDRAGGISVDSVSKSGTNRYAGLVSFQFQNADMAKKLKNNSISRFEKNQSWTSINLGGPVQQNKLFFYGSYYRPTSSRDNPSNAYGVLPEYHSRRHEGFGKLTYTPISSALINFSFRRSNRLDTGDVFAAASAPTSGTGAETDITIATGEGSWIVNSNSYFTFKVTHFANENSGRPDNISDAVPSTTLGTHLDIDALDTLGRVSVPTLVAGADAYNAFVTPLINRYGYDANGVRNGGGIVGYGLEFNDQDFFRDNVQVGYNYTLNAGGASHEFHGGIQWYKDSEDLLRKSNGWGLITVPGGRLAANTNAYYIATFSQQSVGTPPIHSEYQSLSLELNDNIRWKNLAFNFGVLLSRDKLYGMDLKNTDSTVSGFEFSPGSKYLMYTIPFAKMIQPRLGGTWAYDSKNTIYASYAQYNPAASSLPRAASWARNRTTTVDARFDINGNLIEVTPVSSSAGKLFQVGMTPRTIDEFVVGTSRQLTNRITGRIYTRIRNAAHFWEDTNNTARQAFADNDTFVNGVRVPRLLYINNLAAQNTQITGSSTATSYVIAELDGSYTKYREVTLEGEWRSGKTFVRGSYTWSHYYGNFDQDNTTTTNDANVFLGSSFIADAAGRQLWNFRDGDLKGDRPHAFKIYGYRQLPWQATMGAYFIAQSGQPWEAWSYEPYIALTTSTSDASRLAEPAGSRRTDAHYQLDLNYTQNFRVGGRYGAQIVLDVYNIGNKQTGYNIQNAVHTANFGVPRNLFDPARAQLSFRFNF